MKSNVMGIGTLLSEKELKELTKETKETLAVGDVKTIGTIRVFGSVDMWNAQRRRRTSASMTRRLN